MHSSFAIILKRKIKLVALLLLSYSCIVTVNVPWGFRDTGYLQFLLPGIYDIIHFTSRDMGYCHQYFRYIQGY